MKRGGEEEGEKGKGPPGKGRGKGWEREREEGKGVGEEEGEKGGIAPWAQGGIDAPADIQLSQSATLGLHP